jgi:hypothetical protein
LFDGLRGRRQHRERGEGRQGREHDTVNTDAIGERAVGEGRNSVGDQIGWDDQPDGLHRSSEDVRQRWYHRRHHVGLKEDDEGRHREQPEEPLALTPSDRIRGDWLALCHCLRCALLSGSRLVCLQDL